MRSGNGGACLLTWAAGLQNLTLNTLLRPYRRMDSLSLSTPSYAASTRGILLTLPCPANTYVSWMVLSSRVPRHDGAPSCALPSPSFWTSSFVTLHHSWNDLMSVLSSRHEGRAHVCLIPSPWHPQNPAQGRLQHIVLGWYPLCGTLHTTYYGVVCCVL